MSTNFAALLDLSGKKAGSSKKGAKSSNSKSSNLLSLKDGVSLKPEANAFGKLLDLQKIKLKTMKAAVQENGDFKQKLASILALISSDPHISGIDFKNKRIREIDPELLAELLESSGHKAEILGKYILLDEKAVIDTDCIDQQTLALSDCEFDLEELFPAKGIGEIFAELENFDSKEKLTLNRVFRVKNPEKESDKGLVLISFSGKKNISDVAELLSEQLAQEQTENDSEKMIMILPEHILGLLMPGSGGEENSGDDKSTDEKGEKSSDGQAEVVGGKTQPCSYLGSAEIEETGSETTKTADTAETTETKEDDSTIKEIPGRFTNEWSKKIVPEQEKKNFVLDEVMERKPDTIMSNSWFSRTSEEQEHGMNDTEKVNAKKIFKRFFPSDNQSSWFDNKDQELEQEKQRSIDPDVISALLGKSRSKKNILKEMQESNTAETETITAESDEILSILRSRMKSGTDSDEKISHQENDVDVPAGKLSAEGLLKGKNIKSKPGKNHAPPDHDNSQAQDRVIDVADPEESKQAFTVSRPDNYIVRPIFNQILKNSVQDVKGRQEKVRKAGYKTQEINISRAWQDGFEEEIRNEIIVKESKPDPSTLETIVRQVSYRITKGNAQEITLRVVSEGFGELSIRARIKNGQMEIEFRSQNEEVRQWLSENSTRFSREMSRNEIEVTKYNVMDYEQEESHDREEGRQQGRKREQKRRQERQHNEGEEDDEQS